jgi:hypothetical protein
MSALDPQLARLTLLLADAGDRPSPEPTEAEIVQVIDHLGAQEAQVETAKAAR